MSNNSWFLKLKKQPTPRDEEKESFKSKESPMEVDKTISLETKYQVLQSIYPIKQLTIYIERLMQNFREQES